MRMSTSSKSTRFPAQFIPSFLALNKTETESAEDIAPLSEPVASIPAVVRRLQVDARLEVIEQDDGVSNFVLHSRMNARILKGSFGRRLKAAEDKQREVRNLLTICTHESSFELQSKDGGFVWSLLGAGAQMQGHSDTLPDEALARATLRLITGQAARALRSLELES